MISLRLVRRCLVLTDLSLLALSPFVFIAIAAGLRAAPRLLTLIAAFLMLDPRLPATPPIVHQATIDAGRALAVSFLTYLLATGVSLILHRRMVRFDWKSAVVSIAAYSCWVTAAVGLVLSS